jgi:hypothetical protein
MSSNFKFMSGKVLLTLVAVFTVAAPFLADWNETHIYNPLWLPHAKFHNAQTMAMAMLLGITALFFLWRNRSRTDLFAAILFASLYWVTQAIAFVFPGVAWTDPNLLQAGQSLTNIPQQIKLDAVMLVVIGLCAWLTLRGTPESTNDS